MAQKKATKKTDIIKYPNRRLYCQVESRYITLQDVYDRIKAGRPVRIIEKKTQTDITLHVLLQVVCERQAAGEVHIKLPEVRDILLRDSAPLKAAA